MRSRVIELVMEDGRGQFQPISLKQAEYERWAGSDARTLLKGAFYILPSLKALKALGLSSEAFVEFLLSRAQVATVPGPAFGMYGEGYIRLAYSTSYDDIAEGLERIGEAAKQLN